MTAAMLWGAGNLVGDLYPRITEPYKPGFCLSSLAGLRLLDTTYEVVLIQASKPLGAPKTLAVHDFTPCNRAFRAHDHGANPPRPRKKTMLT